MLFTYRLRVDMDLSAYIDAILGVLKYAVFVDIPCFHIIPFPAPGRKDAKRLPLV